MTVSEAGNQIADKDKGPLWEVGLQQEAAGKERQVRNKTESEEGRQEKSYGVIQTTVRCMPKMGDTPKYLNVLAISYLVR